VNLYSLESELVLVEPVPVAMMRKPMNMGKRWLPSRPGEPGTKNQPSPEGLGPEALSDRAIENGRTVQVVEKAASVTAIEVNPPLGIAIHFCT
jgi:hypothetical protein